jgi:hypothetical protein
MQIDLDVIDKIIEKYGSRKSLSAIIGMYLITLIVIPDDLMWLKAVQILGITVLGGLAVVCQWNLDRKPNSNQGETQ